MIANSFTTAMKYSAHRRVLILVGALCFPVPMAHRLLTVSLHKQLRQKSVLYWLIILPSAMMRRRRSIRCSFWSPIRAIMAQSCHKAGLLPREVGFKATIQTLEAFQPLIAASSCRSVASRETLYEQVIEAIVVHQVGNRPGRLEPRLRKRRTKKYDFMMTPRNEANLEILQRLTH